MVMSTIVEEVVLVKRVCGKFRMTDQSTHRRSPRDLPYADQRQGSSRFSSEMRAQEQTRKQ
jgi:hypothetical protein